MSRRHALLIVIATLVLAGVLVSQVYHHLAYGHFAPIGLHVDAVWADGRPGSSEPSRMYWPVLTNFGLWPATLDACHYLTDVSTRGTDYAVAIQRWNATRKQWDMVPALSLEELCAIAIPTSRGVGTLDTERLWPGFSMEAKAPEAIGTGDGFEAGDLARFVVFRTGRRSPHWTTALFSDAFVVTPDPVQGH